VVGVALLCGARFGGGLPGMLVMIGCGVLLAVAFAALSDAVALLVRSQEALIGVSQFLTMPLTFLSSVLMAPALMPGWVADVARFNPVDWAAVGSREALSSVPDWTLIGRDLGLLLALALLMAWLTTRAFRSYQRSA
jgi:ABC-2 type transport system permease protein